MMQPGNHLFLRNFIIRQYRKGCSRAPSAVAQSPGTSKNQHSVSPCEAEFFKFLTGLVRIFKRLFEAGSDRDRIIFSYEGGDAVDHLVSLAGTGSRADYNLLAGEGFLVKESLHGRRAGAGPYRAGKHDRVVIGGIVLQMTDPWLVVDQGGEASLKDLKEAAAGWFVLRDQFLDVSAGDAFQLVGSKFGIAVKRIVDDQDLAHIFLSFLQ